MPVKIEHILMCRSHSSHLFPGKNQVVHSSDLLVTLFLFHFLLVQKHEVVLEVCLCLKMGHLHACEFPIDS